MRLVREELAGISFVFGVMEESVWAWRRSAVHQAEASNRHRLQNLPVPQGQLDETLHCVERQHAGETDAAGER